MTETVQNAGMNIYIADVRAFADTQLFEAFLASVPVQRGEQIRKYRVTEDRMRGLGAGLLLEYGLRTRGYTLLEAQSEYRKVTLEKGRYGKPYIADVDGLCFNLSHAGDYVAAVFGKQAVGIDVEQIRAVRKAFTRRFFTEEECAYLEQIKAQNEQDTKQINLAFTKMWTRKESYIKAVGEGMHLPLTDFCVLSDQTTRGDTYYWRTWEIFNEYALSVCTKMPVNAEITEVDLTKSI